MGLNLPKQVEYILNKLNNSGFEAYVVGGCVRDSIIGLEPHDWDICTSALPEQTIELFNDNKVLLTGMQHGTITVIVDSEHYEITTFRTDGEYGDNRHPDNVEFVSNLRLDLMRRDFTINAMAYNENTGITDLFGGLDDLKNRTIRCVGNPDDRFKEDALRMVRAIRFAERFNFEIELDTYCSILNNKMLIKNVSMERINYEILKILDCKNKLKSKDSMLYLFILLKEIIPEISSINFDNMYNRLINVDSNLYLRLSVFFDTFFIEYIMTKLKFSNDFINTAFKIRQYGYRIYNSICSYYYRQEKIPYKYKARFLLNKLDFNILICAIRFAKYLNYEKNNDILHSIYELQFTIINSFNMNDVYCLSRLDINGYDLENLGISGKQIGLELNRLLENVMLDRVKNKKEDLIKYLNIK